MDPGFWTDAAPCSWGDPAFAAWCEAQEELRGHVLFQTSGSSGAPKWIALSKDALLLSAAAVNRHLAVEEFDVWGLVLPPHHVGGFGVVARAFEAACGLAVFPGKWNADAFVAWIEREGVTHTSLVPTQVHDLAVRGLRCPAGLRAVVVGGGRLEDDLGRDARELGWPVLASYGMTEAGSQVATQSLEILNFPYQSAPLPLLPIWRARTDDEERLWVSGPALFSGQVTGESGSWQYEPREGEWYRSGDRASLTEGGLTILGRADSLLKILGELVDPEGVERDLAEAAGDLPAGSFAVAAVPDHRAGHVLVPVFSSAIGKDAAGQAVAAYNALVPGFKRLLPPLFVADLPRTELGKIRRAELVDLALRGISGLSSTDVR
jgi:O-succinylbenzoic acid--CoA ligase